MNKLLFPMIGLVYGVFLAFLGAFAGGAGHGTFVVIGLYSSPFGLMPTFNQKFPLMFLVVTPALWCVIGFLLARLSQRRWRVTFLVTMFVHYFAVPFVWQPWTGFGDWEYARKYPGVLTAAFLVYGMGQVFAWTCFISEQKKRRTAEGK